MSNLNPIFENIFNSYSMKEPSIKMSTDYDKFCKFNGNRGVNQLHVKRIVKSMSEQFLIKPIDVNEKFEIIDGQHRFEACKQTKNPIYYIVHEGWGLNEAHRLNANQKNWTTEEYLRGYCDLGLKDYIDFKNLMSNFPELKFSVLFAAAIGNSEKAPGIRFVEFKNGTFKFKDRIGAEKKLSKLMAIKPYYDGYNKSAFAWAIFKALSNNKFSFPNFLQKLAYQRTKLVDCTDTKQYLKLIEAIYNFRRREENVRLF